MVRLAFVAGLFGATCSAVIIGAQDDVASLNWPFLLVPAFVMPLIVFRRRAVQMSAAVAMAVWCSVWSLGFFFVPCTVLMFGAARRSA
jgi:hypothetical protein